MSESLSTRLERLERQLHERTERFSDKYPNHPSVIVPRMLAEIAAAGPQPSNPELEAYIDRMALCIQRGEPWPPSPNPRGNDA